MKLSVELSGLITTIKLQTFLDYNKIRITKVMACTKGMNYTNNILLFTVNNMTNGVIYDNVGNLRSNKYTFSLFFPSEIIASWDRLINDWDFENSISHSAKDITIEITNNNGNLQWTDNTSIVLELEFK
jgi:hypothetical protein